MLRAKTRPITIEQGSTWKWGFVWYMPQLDVDGNPILISGQPVMGDPRVLTMVQARMQVRRTLNSAPAIDATSENGLITVHDDETGPNVGRIDFLFPAVTTQAVTFEEGLYDIEVIFPTEEEGGTVRAWEGPVAGVLNVTR